MNNPILDVTWFGGCDMTTVGPDQKTKMKWMELVDTLSEHIVTDDKDGLMFNCWRFSGNNRDSDSCDVLTALIIDIDGQQSITDARNAFYDIEHCGYTSFGHNTDSKDYVDCFRIIIPLQTPITKTQLENKRYWLRENIGCDKSSFDISRAFYAPSCLAENVWKAQTWYNEGELLDVLEIPDEVIPVFEDKGSFNIDDEKIRTLIDNLSGYYVGYEPVWATTAWVMASNGFDFYDFQRVSNGMMNSKTDSQVQQKWKAAKRKASNKPANGIGYLYNVLKGKHNGK